MTAADRDEAARALERSNLTRYWKLSEPGVASLRASLARLVPGATSIDRIAYLLVCARAGGVDIGAAVRQAQHSMDELQLEATTPTERSGDEGHNLRLL